MSILIDFSDCEIEHTKVYDGLNGKKLSIYYENEMYMLKFPKDTHISDGYASSTVNEYISSHIFKTLGFETQETFLGYYNDKKTIVVACKDFERFNKRLMNFGKVKNSVLNDSSSSFVDTDLYETLNIIDNQKLIDKSRLREFYFDMFIADTFIANFDRHNGNWGLLRDEKGRVDIAPIYDCGSSLYPKLNNEEIKKCLEHKGSFNDLILNHTTSAITINDKKINPQNFLLNFKDENIQNDIKKSLTKIVNKINLEKINSIIDDIEFISSERKDFYKLVLKERKKFLEKCLKIHSPNDDKNPNDDNRVRDMQKEKITQDEMEAIKKEVNLVSLKIFNDKKENKERKKEMDR